MPVAPEVDAFQREVGRDQRFVSRQRAQHGAVVSNSGTDGSLGGAGSLVRPPSPARRSHSANLGNQRFFQKRHGAITIPPEHEMRVLDAGSTKEVGHNCGPPILVFCNKAAFLSTGPEALQVTCPLPPRLPGL